MTNVYEVWFNGHPYTVFPNFSTRWEVRGHIGPNELSRVLYLATNHADAMAWIAKQRPR
jgi:hypothetical protein